MKKIKVNKEKLIWSGRFLDNKGIRYFDYSASGFCFVMKGCKAEATFLSDAELWTEENQAVLGIFITEGKDTGLRDIPEEPGKRIILGKKENKCLLFESEIEKTVCVRVMKFSEAAFAYAGLKEIEIEGELIETSGAKSNKKQLKLEFIGDSITCGYGIEGVWEKDTFTTMQERPDKAYAFLTARTLDAQVQLCSWSGIGLISNYVDPETENLPATHWLMPSVWPYTDKSLSLRLGLEPEVWNANRYDPDIVIINIGTNDISWIRGIEDRRMSYVAELRQLLEAVHRRSPGASICCCLGLMGEELNASVRESVELFKKDFQKVKAGFLAFKEQDEKDGIGTDWHPSAATHRKAAEKLSRYLLNL